MINLTEALNELGYSSEVQKHTIIKLLAFDKILKNPNEKEISENVIISDNTAKAILSGLNFKTLDEAINFLVETTQKVWLRLTHAQEGVHHLTQM